MTDTVLIVDDSLTVRMDLAGAFEAAGFRALPRGSAGEARVALACGTVDVVVLDIILPDGDGIDLLREIRSAPGGASKVVLVLSTEAEVKDRILGLRTGADEYVGKPYEAEYLVGRARGFLQRRRESVAPAATTVLVIDDSRTFREELRRTLEAAGYSVLDAGTGEEGLRMAADRRPAAILVDGSLPGMDGQAVIRHVRLDAALRSVPCLLLTGSEERRAELAALDAGADSFVRKTEDVAVVLARLEAAIRSAPLAALAGGARSLQGPKRILAVDDSMTFLQEVASVFREDGYDVAIARSGEEALELLAVQPVDCILLDLVMPGMTGQETCRRIKAAPVLRNTPIVMLTALEDRDAMIQGLGSGADDFISKGSELDVLRARVRAQIRRKQFEDENRRIREELLEKELEAAAARAAMQAAEARASLAHELEVKNRELESFTYSVSHDLRAPLRAIAGFSEVLMSDHAEALDGEARRCLEVVVSNTRRMGDLIDDLLDFSRMARAAMDPTEVDVAELADTAFEELRGAEPGRAIRFRRGDLPRAIGDVAMLRQVLVNLLSNAIKYSRGRDPAVIEVGGRIEGPGCAYWVSDNGVGFDMRYAHKLFGVFQRLHLEKDFEGTGVGLALVARIVERHGGRVWAESSPGKGATFHFTVAGREACHGPPCGG